MRCLWLFALFSLFSCAGALTDRSGVATVRPSHKQRRTLPRPAKVPKDEVVAPQNALETRVEKSSKQPPSQRQLITQLAVPVLLPLLVRRLTARWDFSNVGVIRFTRLSYAAFVVVVQLVLAFIRQRIDSLNDLTVIDVPDHFQRAQPQHQTVRDYDMAQLSRLQWETVSNMLIGSFFHFVKKWHQPVLIQIPLTLISLWSHPLVQIHVRRAPAEGPLQRPFQIGAAALLQRLREHAEPANEADKSSEEEQPVTTTVTHEGEARQEDEDAAEIKPGTEEPAQPTHETRESEKSSKQPKPSSTSRQRKIGKPPSLARKTSSANMKSRVQRPVSAEQ